MAMFKSPGAIAFSLGPIDIYYYGIIIGLGIVAAFIYATFESRRRGRDTEILYDIGFWVVLAGIIGARIYYVIFQWEHYITEPIRIFALWEGGLAIHGALIGGFLAFLVVGNLKKLPLVAYLDIAAPGVILAQAIGRWGNFFNSEAFGTPSDLPWKLFIPLQSRPLEYAQSEYFHPAFLYESLWNLFVFAALVFLTRKLYPKHTALPAGLIICAYLILYSIGRFFIEGLRVDSLYIGTLRTAQVISIVLFAVGLVGLLFMIKRIRRA